MSTEQGIIFQIPEKHRETIAAWQAQHQHPSGAIGGATSFVFTPTSIGLIIKVKCCCCSNADLDLSDYEEW
jgi:hypothetical protein